MDMSIPEDVTRFTTDLDEFIDTRIVPIQEANPEYFDHRREYSRTDLERGGIPSRRWREIMHEARVLADKAGFYRYPLPRALGGQDASNVAMAVIREHLAHRGPGLHAELPHEASMVANLPLALVLHEYGTPEQKEMYLERLVSGDMEMAFGLTEPQHGSDATWLETRAVRDGDDWVITGEKRFNSVVDVSELDLVFARTGGEDGKAEGITAFLVPTTAEGFEIPYYHYCFNMPSDHAEVHLTGVRVPSSAVVGEVGRGLDCAQLFVHENRIRQAASGVGAAQYCIDESVAYARRRVTFGKPLAERQAIQFPLVELVTEAELVRTLIRKTAVELDELTARGEPAVSIGHRVSMCNYRGNRLVCDAADRAMQVHGAMGYSRHLPFEHIYRHHRRYRITEGSEEIQMRRVAGALFGYLT
jgi:alkylation response protein AidB-like acyl-CoA dehydrogenase